MTQPASPSPAPTILIDAWQRFSSAAWKQHGDAPSTEQSRADENLLSTCIAETPAAIAVKLRYALYLNAAEPWLQSAALGAEVPGFTDMLAADDTINEAIWSSIQSLEAMEART